MNSFFSFLDAVKIGNSFSKMPLEAIHTSEYILFKDQLFDYVNGQSINADKPLRNVIKEGSSHIEFWEQAKKKIRNRRFVHKKTKMSLPNPPCLKEWPNILTVLKTVWHKVEELGFPYLKLGLLNQDALENFFFSFARI